MHLSTFWSIISIYYDIGWRRTITLNSLLHLATCCTYSVCSNWVRSNIALWEYCVYAITAGLSQIICRDDHGWRDDHLDVICWRDDCGWSSRGHILGSVMVFGARLWPSRRLIPFLGKIYIFDSLPPIWLSSAASGNLPHTIFGMRTVERLSSYQIWYDAASGNVRTAHKWCSAPRTFNISRSAAPISLIINSILLVKICRLRLKKERSQLVDQLLRYELNTVQWLRHRTGSKNG